MTQGVYTITSKTTGKSYVGASSNVELRFRAHIKHFENGTHTNPRLQAAWNEYGENDFIFSVLEEVATSDDLGKREQYYMDRQSQTDFNIISRTNLRVGHPESSGEYISFADTVVLLNLPRHTVRRLVRAKGMRIYHSILDERWLILLRSDVEELQRAIMAKREATQD